VPATALPSGYRCVGDGAYRIVLRGTSRRTAAVGRAWIGIQSGHHDGGACRPGTRAADVGLAAAEAGSPAGASGDGGGYVFRYAERPSRRWWFAGPRCPGDAAYAGVCKAALGT